MKTCFKCETAKPLSEFYRHKYMADGHLNKCKACARKDVALHREANIEKIREYDRMRGALPSRVADRTKNTAAWRAKDRRRQVAHSQLRRAVISGSIARLPCFICGDERSVAHHPDYSLPLAVSWMCQAHHRQTHVLADKLLSRA